MNIFGFNILVKTCEFSGCIALHTDNHKLMNYIPLKILDAPLPFVKKKKKLPYMLCDCVSFNVSVNKTAQHILGGMQ